MEIFDSSVLLDNRIATLAAYLPPSLLILLTIGQYYSQEMMEELKERVEELFTDSNNAGVLERMVDEARSERSFAPLLNNGTSQHKDETSSQNMLTNIARTRIDPAAPT